MTFDAWIARILGALKEEDGAVPRPASARPPKPNRNPVELRRIGGEPPSRVHAEPVLFEPPPFEQPAQAAAVNAPPPVAPAKPQRAVPRIRASRASLLQTTATGAVQFVRTSEAELARRRAERARIEAERLTEELARLAAAEKERAKRNPGWVRYSRTPDSMLRARPAKEDVPPAKAQEIETDPHEPSAPDASGTPGPDIAAIVDLVNDLHRNVRAPRGPLVEILIPRTATMARTDVFLGDLSARIAIEEHDVPGLRLAPQTARAHIREIPAVRTEIQRLADMLTSVRAGTPVDNEDERLDALKSETKALAPVQKARARQGDNRAGGGTGEAATPHPRKGDAGRSLRGAADRTATRA